MSRSAGGRADTFGANLVRNTKKCTLYMHDQLGGMAVVCQRLLEPDLSNRRKLEENILTDDNPSTRAPKSR